MYEKILVASDGSGPSIRAAQAAAVLAKAFSSQVTALTSAYIPRLYEGDMSSSMKEGYLDEWRAVLDATVEALRAEGIEPEAKLIQDEDPAAAILKELRDGGYDLLAVGRTGAGNPASKTMGGISEKLTTRADCSMLIVR
jgi:nucleotide-binding universal stress UspA family protein